MTSSRRTHHRATNASSSHPANARTRGTTRRRALAQNFLTDPAVARYIVAASGVGPTDLVLEIGAGTGMLTHRLAPACREVVAYELDPAHADKLAFRVGSNVHVIQGDFHSAEPPREPFAVIGNIPYTSTTRIVRWCLTTPGLTSATLVVQREYARKHTGGYGRWSKRTVSTWPQFAWSKLGHIPRDRFTPIPSVDSAILRLERREPCLLPSASLGAYQRLVELGFTGVGGSLRASLRRRYPQRQVDAALAAAGVGRQTAVGFVSPDQWLILFQTLHTIDGSARHG